MKTEEKTKVKKEKLNEIISKLNESDDLYYLQLL